jgi:hypothetical protein
MRRCRAALAEGCGHEAWGRTLAVGTDMDVSAGAGVGGFTLVSSWNALGCGGVCAVCGRGGSLYGGACAGCNWVSLSALRRRPGAAGAAWCSWAQQREMAVVPTWCRLVAPASATLDHSGRGAAALRREVHGLIHGKEDGLYWIALEDAVVYIGIEDQQPWVCINAKKTTADGRLEVKSADKAKKRGEAFVGYPAWASLPFDNEATALSTSPRA